MSVDQINTTFYSHVHFAFATLTSSYAINVTGIEDQLSLFSNMTGIKRVLSIGGWSISTDASTYMIFRDAVTSANRDTLITNVVDFLEKWDLDGVDFDWEYPDEPDIEGIPAGTTADSTNYYITLDLLKTSMPIGKTLSLTVPASFWYLERFPIEAISTVADYIVYMTYDLHGQWDYDNAYSDDGCSAGNCLRSHVNLTETLSALSMITKAGVSSNKVAVGTASYARSFEMTEAGCWTDMCTYTGPDSGAWPGPCTDTAGYISNYELELVIAENPSAVQYWDNSSYTNILVFNETQWAGYMNDTNKAVRTTLYESLNFLGTSDWAVDLQSEDGNEEN
ncbi:CAZyme family GH18 [Penicillium roqueforti]|nr:CAZyme family GH18 [Penicillium roqueforti]